MDDFVPVRRDESGVDPDNGMAVAAEYAAVCEEVAEQAAADRANNPASVLLATLPEDVRSALLAAREWERENWADATANTEDSGLPEQLVETYNSVYDAL